MKKHISVTLLLISCLLFSTSADAQRWFRTSSLEFGLMVGGSHYSGDLTQSFFEAKGLKPSVGIITRYTPGQLVTFRLSGQYGGLEGDDRWYEDQNDNNRRNLHFKSVLWDFTGAVEVNFARQDLRQARAIYPYVFGGISVFKFNPKTQFEYDPASPHATRVGTFYSDLEDRDGEWVALQPLGTEGQGTTEFNERERYHLTQLAIPVGAGVKFKMNHKWTLSAEYGIRKTFTDYIDDVSTTYVEPTRIESQYGPMAAALADRSPNLHPEGEVRGNPDSKDLYGILGLTLTYRIYGKNDGCPTW